MIDPFANLRKEDIELDGYHKPIGGKAYRVDGDAPAGMRAQAKLGDSLECCDYLHRCRGKFILIEDTKLGATISRLKKEHDSRRGGRKREGDRKRLREFVRKNIRRENCLKVYGTMLVLFRLLKKWPPPCEFWLVTTDGSQDKFARNLELKSAMKKALQEANIVQGVKLMPAKSLRKELDGV